MHRSWPDSRLKVTVRNEMVMKKGVIILDRFGDAAGATRMSFYEDLARYVDVVWVYALKWGEHDHDMKPLWDWVGNDVDIAWVLSINGYGTEGEVHQLAERYSCPVFAWYWDSPYLLGTQPLPEGVQLLHACEDFAVHPALAGRSRFLPFSGVPPDPADMLPKPHKGICFMGTCWSAFRIGMRLAGGVHDHETEELLVGTELFDAIQNKKFFDQNWVTPAGFDISNREVFSYYSTAKRLHYLSSIAHLDLHVYGRADWFVNGLPLFPNLAPCLNLRTVNNTREMRALFNEHRVSLNIFHHQNRGGGPNFRTLESATHRIPVLSEFNRVCAELFPPGEAALYFSNADEMIEGAKELEANAALRATLTENAAEILMQQHLHKHRCATLFDWAGRNAKQAEAGHGTVILLRNTADGLIEERPGAEISRPPEPLLTSRERKAAAFKADADLLAKRRLASVQQRLGSMRQRLDKLQKKNQSLQDETKNLRTENTRMKSVNKTLHNDNKSLRKRLDQPGNKTLTMLRRRLTVLK